MSELNKAGDGRGKTRSTDIVNCKKCGLQLEYGKMRRHHLDVHGLTMNKRDKTPPAPADALSMFQNMRETGKIAMLQIDEERDKIHKRLLELDALAARVKKVIE